VSIVKNITLNSIIGVVSKIIVFALLPIILKNSNPTLYGQYGLFLILILWFEKITVGPFTNGLARWFHRKDIDKLDFSEILFTSSILSIIFATLGSLGFHLIDPVSYFIISFLVIFTTVIYSYIESSLRFQGFHKKVAIYLGIRNISIPFFQVIFLNYEISINSFIVPIILGNVIFSILSLDSFKKLFVSFDFSLPKIKGMLAYSFPLIIVGFSVTSFFLIDRYLVKLFFGFEKLAELTLAFQISAILSISISTPIKQVIVPDLLSLENDTLKFKKIVNKIYGLISFISIVVIFTLYILHDFILIYLDDSGNYQVNRYLVFLFLMYHFFSTMSVFYRAPFLLNLKSKLISYVSIGSMIVSLIFLFLFLEKDGLIIIGYSYIIMSLMPIFIFRFINKEEYQLPNKIIFIELFLFLSLCLLMYFNVNIF
tara:strand:- start:150 stop:1430 length:1281 start_codon:yes stop_codon:yes gene_type:complete